MKARYRRLARYDNGQPPSSGGAANDPAPPGKLPYLPALRPYHRSALSGKLRGLSEEDARRRLVPSLTTMLGLVSHAAAVERNWFQHYLGGRPREEITGNARGDAPSWDVGAGKTIGGVIAELESACAASRQIDGHDCPSVTDMETTVAAGADKLWAQDSGGSGPVVILLHSGVGDSRQWDQVWPALTGSCRVIRYDVRAFGRSPAATQEYSLESDLRLILDHFQLQRVHLVGCSMGGGTALGLALADPGRVQSLTLLCPGIPDYPWPPEPELEAEFEAMAATGDEDAMVGAYQRLWAAAGAEPAVLDQLRTAIRAEPNEEQFQRPGGPVFGRLHELSVPTVLMVGDLDRPVLITSNEEVARRIPGCRLIWMPGVDHMPAQREPDLIAQTVLAQVRGSEPPG